MCGRSRIRIVRRIVSVAAVAIVLIATRPSLSFGCLFAFSFCVDGFFLALALGLTFSNLTHVYTQC
jgi:hypothetical protein